MKLLIGSIFIALFLCCTGCSENNALPQKQQEQQDSTIIFISPSIPPSEKGTNSNKNCNDYEVCRENHYYELYLDDKLVYRNRLRTTNEKDEPTKWQLRTGQHGIKIIADGFITFDRQVEIVEKKDQATTTQYFGVVLTRVEQGTKENEPL